MIDACSKGELNWEPSADDYDSDGCQDIMEDQDDDNDEIKDLNDVCLGMIGWESSKSNDYDRDGCRDIDEDSDDDNDGVLDPEDFCSAGELYWLSSASTDYDADGCRDEAEDLDDDNDGTLDESDAFPLDNSEDSDIDGNGVGDNLQAKQEAKFQKQMLSAGGIAILLIAIGALLFFKRRDSVTESIVEIPVMESNVRGSTTIEGGTPLTHSSILQSGMRPLVTPNAATPAEQADGEGYEWLTLSDESKWYRVAQSNSEWQRFEA